MAIGVARIARAVGVGVERIDEAVGDAGEAGGVALLEAQLHVLQAQEGWGGEADNVHRQGIQGCGKEVVEEGPPSGGAG